MDFLAQTTKGKIKTAQIHVVVGENGTGKSTFASSFPLPLMADLESGSLNIDVERLGPDKLPTLKEVRALIAQLIVDHGKFETFIIDSIESLEALIFDSVCIEGKSTSIEEAFGGYGKGYSRSREIMREIMMDLHKLRDKGVTCILVGHTQKKSHTDPTTNQTYDRVVMRANDKLAAVVRDLADNVLMVTHKVFTTTEKGKTKAFGDGQRVIYSAYRPSFDAKNRLDLPFELPLSYDAFKEACDRKPSEDVAELISEINEMIPSLDAQMQTAVKASVEKFKTNPTKLREIKNRAMTYLNK